MHKAIAISIDDYCRQNALSNCLVQPNVLVETTVEGFQLGTGEGTYSESSPPGPCRWI